MMYEPAPPRRKKTSIVRTRGGCKNCRRRRTKCDQRKPVCSTCSRLGIHCETQSPQFEFRHVSKSYNDDPTQRRRRLTNAAPPPTERESGDVENTFVCVETTERSSNSVCRSDGNEHESSLIHTPCTTLAPLQQQLQPQSTMFYLNVWKSQCLPGLPPAVQDLESLRARSFVVKEMVTALAACRLSRCLPQRKVNQHVNDSLALSFHPDFEHESFGYERYGAVMHEIAKWQGRHFAADPTLSLALLVLFCFIAASMGSFREFSIHSSAVKELVRDHPTCTVGLGSGLLLAWVDVEMQNWWRRAFFSRPSFHHAHDSLSLSPQLQAALKDAGNLKGPVSAILSESHRIHMAALVSSFDRSYARQKANELRESGSMEVTSQESHLGLLKLEAAKLDDWYELLPAMELPIRWPSDQTLESGVLIEPLHFRTHRSAMNFAYYVVARIMQSTRPLETLRGYASPFDLNMAHKETEAWTIVLLQIAAGINWKECVRGNVFAVGFVALLLASVLRSRSLVAGEWVETWLEEQLAGDVFEEGNFPVFQVLSGLRLINRERRAGWDVLALFQTSDDGGGQGKCGTYYSQSITSLWIYGRCRTTGRLEAYSRPV